MIQGQVDIDTEGNKGVDKKLLMDLRESLQWEAIGGFWEEEWHDLTYALIESLWVLGWLYWRWEEDGSKGTSYCNNLDKAS